MAKACISLVWVFTQTTREYNSVRGTFFHVNYIYFLKLVRWLSLGQVHVWQLYMHSWRNAHSKPEPSIWNASKITMSGIFVKVIYSPAKWCEMASLGREPNQGFSCFVTNYDDFITIHGRTWPSIKKFKLRRKNTILYFIQLLNSISRSTKLPDICLPGKEIH